MDRIQELAAASESLAAYLKGQEHAKVRGKYDYASSFVWTDGAFFEIADRIPELLAVHFAYRGDVSMKVIDRYQSYWRHSWDVAECRQSGDDYTRLEICSTSTAVSVCVNVIYFRYMRCRYPEADIMTGPTDAEPVLFVDEGKLRGAVMPLSYADSADPSSVQPSMLGGTLTAIMRFFRR